jgi:hypothetical protein
MSDGITTKIHIVTNLAFTDMDVNADTVSGIAEPGSRVDIWACDQKNCTNRHVDANVNGVWIADFAHPGVEGDEQNTFDIIPGTWVDSRQMDEDGDSTMFGQNVPNPYIEANPGYDWVHARFWPIGVDVTLTIDDPSNGEGVDYTTTATMETPGDPNWTVADFQLNGFDVKAGDTLTVTDGVTSKTYTVTRLQVMSFDLLADTLSGIATPDAQVQVCVKLSDHCVSRYVTADEQGNWTADYQNPGTQPDEQETVDLQIGSNGWAAERDDDGDQTWADWTAVLPSAFYIYLPLVIRGN